MKLSEMKPCDLNEVYWSNLTSDQIVFMHVCDDKSILADFEVISTLHRTYREGRHAACNTHSNVFLPLFSTFAILDQIGECYKPKNSPIYPDPKGSGIKKALYYFAGRQPNDNESKALYAFRNGIMHDCSFVSHDKHRSDIHYWFRFCESISCYVEVASTPWDGVPSSRSDHNITLINRNLLLDLAHNVIQKLNTLFTKGELEVTIPGGAATIADNYLVRRPH
jgi:hypothetical protein